MVMALNMRKATAVVICFLFLFPVAFAETQENYSFAAEAVEQIKKDFGIPVLLGQDAVDAYPYDNYTLIKTEILHSDQKQAILDTLDAVCKAMKKYPAGFFMRELPDVSLCLVGEIIQKRSGSSFSGFCCPVDGGICLFLDTKNTSETKVHHELWHAIEKEKELVFENWNDNNPEGFRYTMDFGNRENFDPDYFYWDYGVVSPAEDRATLFEAFMLSPAEWWKDYPHMKKKLDVMLEAAGISWEPDYVPSDRNGSN